MAHTDFCQIQVLQFVRKKMEETGWSVNKAFQEASKECWGIGIPSETIRTWYKQHQKAAQELVKTNQPTTPPPEEEEKEEDPALITVKLGKGKVGNNLSPFIKIFFSPAQEEIFNRVITHLKKFGKDPGKEHKKSKSFNMKAKEFIDMLANDFELKIIREEVPIVRVETTQEGEPEPPQAEGEH